MILLKCAESDACQTANRNYSKYENPLFLMVLGIDVKVGPVVFKL